MQKVVQLLEGMVAKAKDEKHQEQAWARGERELPWIRSVLSLQADGVA